MALAIEDISIENYRCFHTTEISGFRQVNLIGGKNNVGKTTLLEALYILNMGDAALNGIHFWREEKGDSRINAFYQRNLKEVIRISTKNSKGVAIKSRHIRVSEKDANAYSIILNEDGSFHNYFGQRNDISTHFIPSRNNFLSHQDLTKLYSYARKIDDNNISTLLEGFKTIDSTFQHIEIIIESDNQPVLYLKKENDLTRPIKSYGDAMNRMAEFILRIVSSPNSVLLIDEIENGIHYQTQEQIWDILFQLAIKHNVQIFATTHSLEMIKSFAKLAHKYSEHAAYFEMYRNQRNNEIAAIFHDSAALEYELSHHLEIRGGQIA